MSECKVKGCTGRRYYRGFCKAHWDSFVVPFMRYRCLICFAPVPEDRMLHTVYCSVECDKLAGVKPEGGCASE